MPGNDPNEFERIFGAKIAAEIGSRRIALKRSYILAPQQSPTACTRVRTRCVAGSLHFVNAWSDLHANSAAHSAEGRERVQDEKRQADSFQGQNEREKERGGERERERESAGGRTQASQKPPRDMCGTDSRFPCKKADWEQNTYEVLWRPGSSPLHFGSLVRSRNVNFALSKSPSESQRALYCTS
eukprot:scaffold363_cov255-Pinguiococcus_pyrenoidosus.AAC.8